MNSRLLTLIMVVFAGMLFLTVGALTAADAPDEVTIENEGYKKDKKGPIKLSHKQHSEDYKVACTECHHDYKDGKNVWKDTDPVKKCSECHDPVKKKGNANKLQLAYHSNCKNCHKDIVAKDSSKKAPFKKCTECHQKKS
ncbi:MAG: cytochrome c3 family protein [Desulfobacteraceae bacterium]|nr:MAG: cytochrome c3 family protein [Desulfobacteraceae bacterium]